MKYRWIAVGFILVLLGLLFGESVIGLASGLRLPGNGAPTVVNYQGYIEESGSPFTGTGYFKFVVVNEAGSLSYWSNDGSSSGGGEPVDAVPIPVSEGMFHVLLGDTDQPNMISLTASAFGGVDRYLRIWFSGDGVTFTQLNPDQRIAAVPYALQAQEALLAEDANTLDGRDSTDFAAPIVVQEVLNVGDSVELASVSGLTLSMLCTDPSGVGDQVLGTLRLVSGADGTEGVIRDAGTMSALALWKEEFGGEINNGETVDFFTWGAEDGQTAGWPMNKSTPFWFGSTLGGTLEGFVTAHVGPPFSDQCALSGHVIAADAGAP